MVGRIVLALVMVLLVGAAQAQPGANDGQAVTVRAERDIGFFAGDLVTAEITIATPPGASLDRASLPVPGPVTYWLDLRAITVAEHKGAVTLRMTYQNFYVALDARPMEIPGFSVRLQVGGDARTMDVPPWTIGVSPLREVAPPAKEDPKAYLQADRPAGLADAVRWWAVAGGLAGAAILALLPLAYHHAWGPFRRRADRPFAIAIRHLRRLEARGETEEGYLEALLVLHRALDRADGRRVLADDVQTFLDRHSVFASLDVPLEAFFQASRRAFFGSAPAQARHDLPFRDLLVLGRALAVAERGRT